MNDNEKEVYAANEAVTDKLEMMVASGKLSPAAAQMHEELVAAIKKAIAKGANPVEIITGLYTQAKAFAGAVQEVVKDGRNA